MKAARMLPGGFFWLSAILGVATIVEGSWVGLVFAVVCAILSAILGIAQGPVVVPSPAQRREVESAERPAEGVSHGGHPAVRTIDPMSQPENVNPQNRVETVRGDPPTNREGHVAGSPDLGEGGDTPHGK